MLGESFSHLLIVHLVQIHLCYSICYHRDSEKQNLLLAIIKISHNSSFYYARDRYFVEKYKASDLEGKWFA